MVRLALGVDFGHGESAGCCVVLRDANGNWVQNSKIEFLNVKNHYPKVYSVLTYENGGHVTFGEITNANVTSYFKKSPKEWDDVDPNSGKDYRTMMRDFIKQLVGGLLNSGVNPTMANYKRDEIVLFVGCPSDETWTSSDSRRKYENLIREATGINEVNVVPESTAAIFSIIHNNPTKHINPKDGVAVFDFGSSTVDFTYIRLGRILAEISWTLGASAIEANIIEKALFDELKLDPKKVWSGDLNSRQLRARRDIKEAWFGDDVNPGYVKTKPNGEYMTVDYSSCDEFGNVVTIKDRAGVDIHAKEFGTILLDEEFMKSVVEEMPVFEVKEKGNLVAPNDKLSWYEYCKRFFTRCRDFMKNHNLPCKTVILTGGASHMDFVMDICNDVFKDSGVEIYRDEAPSYCVCNGLCQIAVNRSRIDDIIGHQKTEIRSKADTALAVYKSDIQNNVTEYIFNSMIKILAKLHDNITVSEFRNEVTKFFEAEFDAQVVSRLINIPFNKMNTSITKSALEASLEATSGFYNSNIDKNSFSIDMDINKGTQIDGIEISGTWIDVTDLTGNFVNILGNAGAVLAGSVVFVVLCETILGPILGGLTFALVKDWIINNPNRKIGDMEKTAKKLKNNADKVKKDIRSSIAKEVADKIVAEQFGNEGIDFNNAVDEMVDKAVRIVALEYFEETIN